MEPKTICLVVIMGWKAHATHFAATGSKPGKSTSELDSLLTPAGGIQHFVAKFQ